MPTKPTEHTALFVHLAQHIILKPRGHGRQERATPLLSILVRRPPLCPLTTKPPPTQPPSLRMRESNTRVRLLARLLTRSSFTAGYSNTSVILATCFEVSIMTAYNMKLCCSNN